MVYFVCETCNETLKKAQVDRHLYSCRNCWGVTCVDCNFTFEGDSFREAKQKNRGVNEIWADAVALAAGNASNGTAPKPLCAHLVRMGDLGNVPRQEKKFKNFVKNSLRVIDEASVAKLWDYVDGVKNDMTREEKQAAAAAAVRAPVVEPSVKGGGVHVDVHVHEVEPKPAAKSKSKRAKKSKKRAREEEGEKEKEKEKNLNTTASDRDSAGVEKRARGHPTAAPTATAGEGGGEEAGRENAGGGEEGGDDGGVIIDAATRKALAKAAVGIVKKAPGKKVAVKELVKLAAAAVLVARGEGGGDSSSPDDQQLRRALKQRLKKAGLRRVTVEDKIAVYSKDSA